MTDVDFHDICQGMADDVHEDPVDRARQRRTARFFVLMEQLWEELGSLPKAVRHLENAVDQSYYYKLRDRPHQAISPDKVATICRVLNLREEFFTDESLGESPDYRDFIGATETVVEYDEDKGNPVIESYIDAKEDVGEQIPERHKKQLRRLAFAYGPRDLTALRVAAIHRALIAEDAQKAFEAPLIETRIETERGQQRITPIKKRRRRA